MDAQASSSKVVDSLKWVAVAVLLLAAIAGNFYFSSEALIYRVVGVLLLLGLAVVVGLSTTRGASVNRLRKDAWAEIRKVVWPTRQETAQTTMIVVAFVFVVALILWLVDSLLSFIVASVLG